MNMYPIARVVTSESREVPTTLLETSSCPVAFAFKASATTSAAWPRRSSSPPDDKFVTAVNALFSVMLAKERADSVSGMTVDSTGLEVEKNQDK